MKGTVVPGPGEPAKLSAAQQGHVEAFWRLTVATASERSWHMLHHTYTFPEGFAGRISVNEQESLQCMARIRETAELILAAEEASKDPEHNDRVVPRHGMELLQLCPSLIAAAQIFPMRCVSYCAQALVGVLRNVWWHRLPLVRLVWSKLRAHSWARSSVWTFIYKLFTNGLVHTKTTQEDVLQHLQHLSRASRGGDVRMTRAFYSEATSLRLKATGDIPMLSLQKGDLFVHGSKNQVTNDCFRARKVSAKSQEFLDHQEIVKQTISTLKAGTQDCYSAGNA